MNKELRIESGQKRWQINGSGENKEKNGHGMRILEREVERGKYMKEESREREVEEGEENSTLKRNERESREMRVKAVRGKLHDKKRVEIGRKESGESSGERLIEIE